ncbi:MAG: hypothetical protein P0116_04950 [Candidatus Nitrosocosmicus sp.]|nr:hypothetical protein [Candidatus Nitrosocosmicus sp.]
MIIAEMVVDVTADNKERKKTFVIIEMEKSAILKKINKKQIQGQ